jgi:carbamoyltransferase
MHVLGISAFHHDSAAALLRDGAIVAAAQEERFTRARREGGFPHQAVRSCLETAGVAVSALEFIGFHEKPLWHVERRIETALARAPAGLAAFRRALPLQIVRRMRMARELDRALGLRKVRYVFVPHHEAHAAAAFYPSPFDEAAILTMDGAGEWATTTLGVGQENRIRVTHEIRYPHSLGLLYAAFASYLGFAPGDGEGHVSDLAPYGEARFAGPILDRLLDVKPDGSFWIDTSLLEPVLGELRATPAFHALFGGPPRGAGEPLAQRHLDVAASLQRAVEEVALRIARHLHGLTGSHNLVLAGGVAHNAGVNGRIVREGPFRRVWVQPAPGDAGAALGTALLIHHQLLDRERRATGADRQSGSLLGPRLETAEAERFLRSVGARYTVLDAAERDRRVAALLAEGRSVVWFQGRMEFGPAALGARSVLRDARRPDALRAARGGAALEASYGPLPGCVLEERAAEWFDVRAGFQSAGVPVAAPVQASQLLALDGAERGLAGLQRLSVPRSKIPAVTHVDGTARVQTVDAARHPALCGVLRAFERATGCPVLAQESFRPAGEPPAQSPEDAWRGFMSSDLDALALEGALVLKSEQRAELEARRVDPATGAERDPALEDLLRCPACGGALQVGAERATCGACGGGYVREEGIWRLFHPHEPYQGDITTLVKGFYEEHPVPNYDEDESPRSLSEKARRGVYARLLGEQIPFGARVLEVGCGTGQLSNFLGLGSRTVVGADLCLNSLRLAEGFRARHGLQRVRFLQMNLFRPAFAPGSFDVVLCNGVLLTTRDPRAGFESIARLVKPGGHIVIGLYNTWGRLAVDSRRVFFRLTGGRMRWVDPYLRKTRMSPEKQDAWFHDQYRHPHETKQSFGEVLGWFDRAGFEFVSSVPKTNPWEPFTERERLFDQASRGSALDRALSQAKLIFTGAEEGGFFVMIARRGRNS